MINNMDNYEFDSINQAHNYIDQEFTLEKIRQRAKANSKRTPIPFECANTRSAALLRCASRIKNKTHRKIYCYLVQACGKGVPKAQVVAFLAKETKMKWQEVLDIERKCFDQISESLHLIITPQSIGEIILNK